MKIISFDLQFPDQLTLAGAVCNLKSCSMILVASTTKKLILIQFDLEGKSKTVTQDLIEMADTRHFITSYCGDLMVLTALFTDTSIAATSENKKYRTFMFRPNNYISYLEGKRDHNNILIPEVSYDTVGKP